MTDQKDKEITKGVVSSSSNDDFNSPTVKSTDPSDGDNIISAEDFETGKLCQSIL